MRTIKENLDYATKLCGFMTLIGALFEHTKKIKREDNQLAAINILKRIELKLSKEAELLTKAIAVDKN